MVEYKPEKLSVVGSIPLLGKALLFIFVFFFQEVEKGKFNNIQFLFILLIYNLRLFGFVWFKERR